MPRKVRFEHKVLSETGQHVITSPDIKGFCIVAETYLQAERDAFDMLALLHSQGLGAAPGRLASIEFEAA